MRVPRSDLWFGLILIVPIIWARGSPEMSLFPKLPTVMAAAPALEVPQELPEDPRGSP